MSAIDHHPHPLQRHPPRKGCLGVLDVAAQRIIDADRLADFIRRRTDVFDSSAEYQAFDFEFDFVIELISVSPKELDPIVIVRIMRGGDDDPRICPQASSYIRDTRSRQRSNEE